ncbi:MULTISPECIES: helix-turn-helix domain-containing protein [Achromobacter]|jgi:transcriptional regulator with XRE-family HTH domain|uniref:helix-turn-helix domain-containing protein n=1 Tax=Achromobacter TaxID=222 RepID=UPI0001F42FE7|nr:MULTISPECIES: helix-turn-helix transcriptional regulator [Achromobacter]AHC44652.1 putative DNA-binding protein [Achromobacter xylosoxidans NBRC 15126 = ATCC 27061]AMH05680.1 XRE family transcriptional regulator [Achromobacter xylosoxidans]AXA75163.1 XRE family transcriptional regulator [Achromobacter xylosoxidans]EFV83728.1 hypothetical protein HMPREF0005_03396 [Achromobacter xylosoxidans C54]KMJ89825.1 DNA-binding protein [Achromobacter xylosoxidans]
MSLALRLRTLMRWRGIKSQNQLARISGVPQSCIHRILTREERYAPTRATLQRLARALDTQVPWLADGMVAQAAAAQPREEEQSDAYCAEICALLRHQPEATRKRVLQVVRLVLDTPCRPRRASGRPPPV